MYDSEWSDLIWCKPYLETNLVYLNHLVITLWLYKLKELLVGISSMLFVSGKDYYFSRYFGIEKGEFLKKILTFLTLTMQKFIFIIVIFFISLSWFMKRKLVGISIIKGCYLVIIFNTWYNFCIFYFHELLQGVTNVTQQKNSIFKLKCKGN